MEQKITFGTETSKKLSAGVNKLADVVESTLGPSGHNVILDLEQGNPVATKDGVTIAKAVKLDDPEENVGAQMLKQASIKTGEEAGDGTTTATVLARSMYMYGKSSGPINTVDFKRGMDEAVKDVTTFIQDKISKPVSNPSVYKQVATISANGDTEIGTLVSKALEKVGSEGAVTIEESKTGESYLDIVEGIQFDRGYKSPYFVTDEGTMTTVLTDAVILICDKRLSTIKELLPALNAVRASEKSLLIIAEDIDTEVLSTLVLNKIRAGFKVCAVKAPEFGDKRKDALQDIATLTGGVVISPEKGMKLEHFNEDWLGQASKITVSRDKTTIIDAKGSEEDINTRIENIKSLLENASSIYDKEQLQTRLARFVGGVAVIYVGGHTELELRERKDRLDDALHATKAAIEEGICPGGGKALLFASTILEKEDALNNVSFVKGYKAVLKACSVPFTKILSNVGIENVQHYATAALDMDVWESYSPLGRCWVNMYTAGIIDPTKVIRLALKNAASVAGTMITSEAMVVNVPNKDDKDANSMNQMMGM